MAKLLYQGHGACRITTDSGFVIYLDPYIGEGYDVPADLILSTHEHHDHTAFDKMPHAANCRIIRAHDALSDGVYHTFNVGGVKISAVEAYNSNHPKDRCVGYILELDGVSVYAAGDTSETEAMKTSLAKKHLDYCLLPGDGVYNMDIDEASRCAREIGAKHSIPIHLKPENLYDEEKAQRFSCPGKLLVRPGEEIDL